MSRILTIKPIGGLGNRMRAIDSAYQLARDHGFQLQVIWELNRFLGAPFLDLFLPVDGLQIKTIENKGLAPIRFPEKSPAARTKTRWLATVLAPKADVRFFQDDFGAWGDKIREQNPHIQMNDFDQLLMDHFKQHLPLVQNADQIYLSSAYRFYSSTPPFLMFCLPADVQRELDQFTKNWEQVIGVHIRRTDHKKSIQHSSDEWFLQQMDQQLDQYPDAHFFLSTDDPEVIRSFRSRYGARLIQRSASFDRKDPGAIREALIDLYLLSRTQLVLGSYFSSFSLTAAQIGGIELFTA
ncbi:MAG: hypothetical protein AAF598_14050 [Bacteroidota bacterium]